MADAPVVLTRQTARRLAITKQHLSGQKPKNPGRSSIMSLFRDIRYVQLDPTSVVAPSHLLVLWSRLGAFKQSDLDRLKWKEKNLFEYWAHRASIVLTEDYPLYQPRMKRFATAETLWSSRLREWMKENSDLREFTLGEIRARGPLSSRDFEDRSDSRWKRSRHRWGLRESAWISGRDVSRMLEFLFHQGEILVAGRRGRGRNYGTSRTRFFLTGHQGRSFPLAKPSISAPNCRSGPSESRRQSRYHCTSSLGDILT